MAARIGLVLALVVGLFAVPIAVVGGVAGAAPTKPTPPTVTPLAATPLSVSFTGGQVTLSATVTNAISCTFTSNKPVPGLPASAPCSNGTVVEGVTLPANTGKKAISYRFKLAVSGTKTVKTTTVVTVGTGMHSGLTGVRSVSTDGRSSCAVLASGRVDCWGWNDNGSLGNGTTAQSDVPVAVTGITDAKAVSTDGGYGFCALRATGGVECWGGNGNHQLGNGTTTDSDVPVAVTGITNASAVSTDGGYGYCAVLTNGEVDCWGWNDYGSLGNGTTTQSLVPVAATGITNAKAVSTDGVGYCAVLTTGGVDCWGYNFLGELGNGTTTSSDVPVAVTGITNAKAVTGAAAAGFGYCAVLTTGGVDCWGANDYGQLGNGTTTDSDVPVAVTGITHARAISTDGGNGYCVVLTTGGVDCWGWNAYGQLGNGTTTDSDVPVAVTGIANAKSASNDGGAYCVVLATGGVDCWGWNGSGALGNGSNTSSDVPVTVNGITNAKTVAGGLGSGVGYCAVLTTGGADCWGWNAYGQLGNGTTTDSAVPVAVLAPV